MLLPVEYFTSTSKYTVRNNSVDPMMSCTVPTISINTRIKELTSSLSYVTDGLNHADGLVNSFKHINMNIKKDS